MYTVEALFFQTKIILIDDDQDFLKSISRHLRELFQIEIFHNPQQALDYILENQKNLETLNFPTFMLEEDLEMGESKLDLTKIHEFSRDIKKNNMITIVISDHEMTSMTGIELFEKLSKKSIMKILLTGKADLKLALDAFNRGLVDKFLVKDTEKMLHEIILNVRLCQKNLFSKISYPILNRLNIPIDSLLNKNDFCVHFSKILENNVIEEYYLIDTTGSFLLKDKAGNYKYFICMLDRQFNDYLNFSVMSEVSKEIINGLENRTHSPVFLSEEDYKLSSKNWERIIYPFEKRGEYYFSLIENKNF